jgi:hypothetical protein
VFIGVSKINFTDFTFYTIKSQNTVVNFLSTFCQFFVNFSTAYFQYFRPTKFDDYQPFFLLFPSFSRISFIVPKWSCQLFVNFLSVICQFFIPMKCSVYRYFKDKLHGFHVLHYKVSKCCCQLFVNFLSVFCQLFNSLFSVF